MKDLISLRLALNILDVNVLYPNTTSPAIASRKIYLVEASGVNLGYRYKWYDSIGLISLDFTSDYQKIIEHPVDPSVLTSYLQQVRGLHKAKLGLLKSIFINPDPNNFNEFDWLGVLISTHFLVETNQLSDEESIEMIRTNSHKNIETGENLSSYFELAKNSLLEHGLLKSQLKPTKKLGNWPLNNRMKNE
jgi:hypothetical protein